jgi:O-antigen/teichoic acid export membrane protein
VLAGVMAPALSTIQEDTARVKRSYLKAIGIVGLVTFPMMTGLFVTTDHLIPALLGARWAGVIPIFKILCGVGLLQSITTTVGWIYQSQGRTDLMFRMTLLGSLGCIIAFVIGIRWGVLGVAWAYCIFSLVWWYPLWATCGSIIGLSFGEMVKTLLPSFACAMVMACIVWGIGHLLPSSMGNWLCLVLQIPFGVFIYVLLVASFKLEAGKEARIALKEMLGGAFSMVSDPLRRRTFPRPSARAR